MRKDNDEERRHQVAQRAQKNANATMWQHGGNTLLTFAMVWFCSQLAAASFRYASGAGLRAAVSTRLALTLTHVMRFKFNRFQKQDMVQASGCSHVAGSETKYVDLHAEKPTKTKCDRNLGKSNQVATCCLVVASLLLFRPSPNDKRPSGMIAVWRSCSLSTISAAVRNRRSDTEPCASGRKFESPAASPTLQVSG